MGGLWLFVVGQLEEVQVEDGQMQAQQQAGLLLCGRGARLGLLGLEQVVRGLMGRLGQLVLG